MQALSRCCISIPPLWMQYNWPHVQLIRTKQHHGVQIHEKRNVILYIHVETSCRVMRRNPCPIHTCEKCPHRLHPYVKRPIFNTYMGNRPIFSHLLSQPAGGCELTSHQVEFMARDLSFKRYWTLQHALPRERQLGLYLSYSKIASQQLQFAKWRYVSQMKKTNKHTKGKTVEGKRQTQNQSLCHAGLSKMHFQSERGRGCLFTDTKPLAGMHGGR